MVKRRQGRSVDFHRLNPDQTSGEAGDHAVTDEIADRQAEDGTFESLPPIIAQLGIEARAEYVRARQRLGLSEGSPSRLGLVGRYQLEAEIGRGGMGIVYRAHDPELDRAIAIKLVQAKPFAQPDTLRSRLLREAKVLAKLTHANVVRVYDCGEHEGEVYLAMEFVEGKTLREWQQGQSRRSLVDAYERAARGLAAAHEMGITHRDFKPDNVLVASDGRVLVGDFGLAGLAAAGDREDTSSPTASLAIGWVSETRTGTLLGTPMYMAPEQLRGEVATARSDQFSFCVSLWEALTGQRPFEAEGVEALLEQIERGKVLGAAKVPRRLRSVLMRGLSEDPEERFADLQVLADALLPRRGLVPGAILVLSLMTGLLMGKGLSEAPPDVPTSEPAPRECPARDSIDAIQADPKWAGLRDRLIRAELRSTYERLINRVDQMREQAEGLCPPGIDDDVRSPDAQRLTDRIKHLKKIVDAALPEDQLRRKLGHFEESFLSASPPRVIDQEVMNSLDEARSYAIQSELDEALAATEDAVVAAEGRDLELAQALRWQGRIQALLGEHEDAIDIYRDAGVHADAAAYDDARLDIMLLAAKTAVMRLGDRERSEDILTRAEGLLRRLGERLISPRRADYHELRASVLKLQGAGAGECDFEVALAHQRYALLIRYWNGNIAKKGMGHFNLARVYEICGPEAETVQVRIHLDQALKILETIPSSPERAQAAFGLGHWLLDQPGEDDWPYAKELLEAASKNPDVRTYALIDLVLLALDGDDSAPARALAEMLHAEVLAKPPSLPGKRRDAWSAIAAGYAFDIDLEAFEGARGSFRGEAQEQREIYRDNPKQLEEIDLDAARLDLTAASLLIDDQPVRAWELLDGARATLRPLPKSPDRTDLLDGISSFEP